jgi:hypothetical protein
LPAGINLISSPLDTGTTPVRQAFGGMGSQWPYIYEWDSSLQQFFARGMRCSLLGRATGTTRPPPPPW